MRKSVMMQQKNLEFNSFRKQMKQSQRSAPQQNTGVSQAQQIKMVNEFQEFQPQSHIISKKELEEFFQIFNNVNKQQVNISQIIDTCKIIKMDQEKIDNLEYTLRKVAKGRQMIDNSDLLHILTASNDEHNAKIVFKQIDYDSTGQLSFRKLQIFLEEHGHQIQDHEILAMIKMAGGQQAIDLNQFQQVFRTNT